MVKIPSMDELKKMGSGLIDQAKAVKFGEIVDKVKSGIESVSGKKAPSNVSDETLNTVFQSIFTSMNELAEMQASQVNTIKKIETQLEQLAKLVEAYQKPPVNEPIKEEDKPHE